MSYAEPATALRALTAPGCIVVVATDQTVIGFAQVQSDGAVHAHLSNILVAPSHRRRGIGRRLVEHAFGRSRALYLDLVSTEGAHDFYRSFVHKEFPGFRIYPGRGQASLEATTDRPTRAVPTTKDRRGASSKAPAPRRIREQT